MREHTHIQENTHNIQSSVNFNIMKTISQTFVNLMINGEEADFDLPVGCG